MYSKKQHIICGICKRLIVFEVPKSKKTLTMELFVTNSCIWSDKGAVQYIRYINGITQSICVNLQYSQLKNQIDLFHFPESQSSAQPNRP